MRRIPHDVRVPWYLVASSLVVVACSGESSSPAVVAAVEVSPAASTLLALEDTRQLIAAARDADGKAIDGKAFTWQSLAPTIATVSSSGLVAAVTNGDAAIRASVDGRSGEAVITVRQAPGQVAFVAAPTAGSAAALLPPIEVAVRDARGHLVLTPAEVTVSLAATPPGPTLRGTTTATVAAGIARFADLWVAAPGSGYTLTATTGSVVSAPTAPFTLGPNPFAGTWTVTPTLSLDCSLSNYSGGLTLQRFATHVSDPLRVLAAPRLSFGFLGFVFWTGDVPLDLPLDQTAKTFGGSAQFSTDTIAHAFPQPIGTVLATAVISIDVDSRFTDPDTFTADLGLSMVPRLRMFGIWQTGTCNEINGTFTATRTP